MASTPIYPGMRIEVLNASDELLFEAKVARVLREDFAEIEKITEGPFEPGDDLIPVRLRCFNAKLNRGLWLEGNMLRFGHKTTTYWLLEKLHVVGQDSGRTYSRAFFSAEGRVRAEDAPEAEAADCQITNLSYGGAAVRTAARFREGATVLLDIRVRKGRSQGALPCIVRRVTERDDGSFDYGCQFVTDTQEQDDRVIRTLLEVQMMHMPNEIQPPPPLFPVV